MASKGVTVAVVMVVIIVIIAGVIVFAVPGILKSKPSTTAGTPFISTAVVKSNIGGNWQKNYFVSGGAHNPGSLVQAYEGIYFSASQLNSSGSLAVNGPSSADLSLIGFSDSADGSNLIASFIYFPNSTAASEAYSNITASLQSNSSVSLSSGTVAGAAYTYVNATTQTNATQAIYSHFGNYLAGFLYHGPSAVTEGGMVGLMKSQVEVLGSSSNFPFPASLATTSQVNSALSLSTDSYVYAVANISGLGNLLSLLNASSIGSSGSASTSTATSVIASEFLGNLTGFGIVTYGDHAKNVTVGSAYLTFSTTTYAAGLYEELNAVFGTNKAYSSSYHQGTVSGSPYFYVNISSGGAQISLLLSSKGNTLVVEYTLSSTVYTYQQLSGLASAQISDL